MHEPRLRIGLNRDWKFDYGDLLEARRPEADVSGWYDVGLPHSFGIPASMDTEFYVGSGTYRRDVEIDEMWIGKHLELEFQGAFQHAEVYLDGLLAGSHRGGYTAFTVDLTPFAHAGMNTLVVRVDNLWDARLAPRAGEHVFNGGLYRDVDLVVTDPVRTGWHGVVVTTPEVSTQSATVEVETELVNDRDRDVTVAVRNSAGALFAGSDSVTIPAHGTATVRQCFVVASPALWHPDSPILHRLDTVVEADGAVVDAVETTFGIRWFEFTADRGFFLNGEPFAINGANVHQDHAGWGDAITHAAIRRDIAMVKEAGMNFIRGSHYPHHEVFAAECDRQGLLFWSEAPFWGMGGENVEGYWSASAYPIHEEDEADFEASCLQALEEMIRVNRAHPSVVVWSTGNEVFFSDDKVMQKARDLTTRLVERGHQLDPTRPVAVGGAQRQGFDVLGDLAGYNGDGASLYQDPGFPNIVSEYGSVISDRPGTFTHRYTDGVEVPQPWRSGVVLWCAFHHASIAPGMGHMGFVDHQRLPLRSWYWYRQNLAGIPAPIFPKQGKPVALRIETDTTTIGTDGTDDAHLIVSAVDSEGAVVASALSVALEVAEGGGQFPSGRSTRLSGPAGSFVDGRGAVDFRSYFAGPNVIVARSEGLESATVTIDAVGDVPWDGRTLRLQAGPPSTLSAPAGRGDRSIAANRPVFASSSQPGHGPNSVTDTDARHTWIASGQAPGAWILLDLEGPHALGRIEIRSADEHPTPAVLEFSDDGRTFSDGVRLVLGAGETTTPLDGRTARYLRVTFPAAPVALTSLDVFE